MFVEAGELKILNMFTGKDKIHENEKQEFREIV